MEIWQELHRAQDLDFLDLLPLAFPHREALYEDNWSSRRALEKELRGEFHGFYHPEFSDEAVEVGNWIYTTALHPPLLIEEIWASRTTSQQLVQAFATNSLPWAFWDVVLQYLHSFEDVFFKASFDSLLEHKQWDHAIELMMLDSKP
ncbi:hypothetical protein C0993_010134 [Termitomyces sp. T159_Od127]|nr:hypothetical protein C0993_010134 [Termitomyces sp. T159_Od127]